MAGILDKIGFRIELSVCQYHLINIAKLLVILFVQIVCPKQQIQSEIYISYFADVIKIQFLVYEISTGHIPRDINWISVK